jgi:murein DD-endopeptidase MepM/ murein hydrolase activator NlpD
LKKGHLHSFILKGSILFASLISFAFHPGDGPKGNGDKPTHITKKELIKIVDSLLELDFVDEKQIELISYYNSLITEDPAKKTIDLSNLNLYESDLDESLVFQPVPESELSDSMALSIENEALSYYTHPKEGVVTSLFGWRDGRLHKGIDVDLNKGEPVLSAFDGKVRIAKKHGGYGNVVIIMHPNGLETVYAHLSRIKVKQGQVVLSGQVIGLGGNTGHSTGSHLHFEVRYKGHALNPSTFISFVENKLLHNEIVIKKSRYGVCAYPSNATFYTVKKGDSWFEIAKQYGLSTKQLCALNGTQKRYYLKVGQKLRIN